MAAFALATAAAAERALYLDVTINGQSAELIGDFVERDGVLFATPEELRALGLLVPEGAPVAADGLVALNDLPGVRYAFDERRQSVALSLPDARRRAMVLSPKRTAKDATPNGLGGLLNYDISVTRSGGETTASLLGEPRFFSPFGVLDASFLAQAGRRNDVVRLDTSWTYEDQDSLTRWRAGDFINAGLSWTRPVRMAGLQVARDFSVRPDLITYPIPDLRGSADVPSTVDVYIDNVRHFSAGVKPGPFEIAELPVVTGRGDARIVVRDVQGRETIRTLPFYASNALLREGLVDYAVQIGTVRHGYGSASFDYGRLAGTGTIRYGLNDSLTLEAHVETAPDLIAGGAGFATVVGEFGTVSGSLAVSASDGDTGAQVSLGYEYQSRGWNLRLSHTAAIGRYVDIAALDGSPVPRSATQIGFGLSFDDGSSVGVAYVGYDGGGRASSRIVSGSYGTPFLGMSQLFATAYVDLGDAANAGVMLSLSTLLGPTGDAGADISVQSGRRIATAHGAYTKRTGVADHGYSISGQVSQGDIARYSGAADWRTPWADFTLAADSIDGANGVRAEMRGSLVFGGEALFLSQRIEDSFAIVDAGLPNVGVMLENRPAGRTGENGLLMVKGLRAYEANEMAIDVADLPPDADFAATSEIVVPSYRGGVMVRFKVRTGDAAVLTVLTPDGQPVPPGSMLAVGGEAGALPIGYDGLAYAAGLGRDNDAVVTLPDGTECTFSFGFAPVSGFVPTLGPFTCRVAA